MAWWARWIFFAALAAFFLVFGIEEMARAYRVKHPGEFLASFFSASFIILISGAILIGSILRMIHRLRSGPGESPRRGEEPEKPHPPEI